MTESSNHFSYKPQNKKIMKNTLALYARQILILFVNLYSIRVILDVLGVEEYGIFSVVAGVVTLSSFLPGTMASATQRFFSFALANNDIQKLNKAFSVNLTLYCIIALIAFIGLESIGLWFVSEYLKIPHQLFDTAIILYHFTVLTFIAGVFTSPFVAILIAHEDMHLYAYASICEALMKLGVVFVLVYLPWNKLELYGILLLAVSILNALIYITICCLKYSECQFRKFYWDNKLLREVLDFTGWTLFGQVTTIVRNQAITILLNQMFNPGIVAAKTIATTVASQVGVFANNFNTGLYPPIIKSYAANKKEDMFSLIFNGSKLTFFLMWIFTLPMLIEMDIILNVWLKTPPLEAVVFTQLALIETLIMSLSLPIATAARAPGRMKMYELTLGVVQIAIFPVSWVVLKIGYDASWVFWVAIAANLLMFVIRLFIVRYLIELPLRRFFMTVIIPVFNVTLLSVLLSLAIKQIMPNGLKFSIVMTVLCFVIAAISMYFLGLDVDGRSKVRRAVANRINHWTR